MLTFEIHTKSEDQTRSFGQRLGGAASQGDVVCLNGDLGAGKTTLTQGIAVGLGLNLREVTSPTYSLIAEHRGGRIALYHMDAYRLNDASELASTGFEEYMLSGDGLFVIEWSSNIKDGLPADRLEIELRHTENIDSRHIVATAFGERSAPLLREAAKER